MSGRVRAFLAEMGDSLLEVAHDVLTAIRGIPRALLDIARAVLDDTDALLVLGIGAVVFVFGLLNILVNGT